MSSSVNEVTLLGNLTRDVEITYTAKGTAIAAFGMAMNRVWKDANDEKQEEVTFVDVTFFGRQAEVIGEYVKKGHKFFIKGRLQLDSWDDKTTGKKRYALRVVGESFCFVQSSGDGKPKAEDRTDHSNKRPPEPPATQPARRETPPPQRRPPPDPDLDAADDDIPFNHEAH